MKRMMLMMAAVVIIAAPALAFHDAGVAHCNGCHTMHNSQSGEAMNYNAAGDGPGTAPGTGYASLLLYENKSDICLTCHGTTRSNGDIRSYQVMSPDGSMAALNSAGDFIALKLPNLNDGHGPDIPGDQAGHNIQSFIRNTTWDTTMLIAGAPGGSLNNNQLACTSCHDPHGNGWENPATGYEGFRLTYRNGQAAKVGTQVVNYTADMVAFPMSMSADPANNNHNVYVDGYGAWCATCHGDFLHSGGAGGGIHPSDTLLINIATVYNAYNGTTDCVTNPPVGLVPCGTGSAQTSYLWQVPIEDPDFTVANITSTDGPDDVNSVVTCVSCHFAHASSGPDSGKWDFNATLLMEDGHNTGPEYALPNPYDDAQRSLCNKCHSKDEYDDLTP